MRLEEERLGVQRRMGEQLDAAERRAAEAEGRLRAADKRGDGGVSAGGASASGASAGGDGGAAARDAEARLGAMERELRLARAEFHDEKGRSRELRTQAHELAVQLGHAQVAASTCSRRVAVFATCPR